NPRSLALKEIEKRGGRTTSSVTSKTTHLLAGVGGGSKLQQAQSLGVTIVDEEQFIRLLEEK
ncbi:MAG: BRCT domain-containing protein, partial [Sphaerochaetaceae bacterium]